MTNRANTHVWLLGLLLTGGCAHPFKNRAEDVTVVRTRIVGLPAFTKGSQIDANDTKTTLDAWTEQMSTQLNGEIKRWVTGNGGHMFPETDTMMVPVVYRKFRKWTATTLVEIAAQKTGHADFDRDSVARWRFEQDLGVVKKMLDADFVLVTLFHDAHQTGGRVFYRALLGPVGGAWRDSLHQTYWSQVGSACLIDLDDGRVVWCNVRTNAWGDLSVPATAQGAVGELLTNLYYPSEPAEPQRGAAGARARF